MGSKDFVRVFGLGQPLKKRRVELCRARDSSLSSQCVVVGAVRSDLVLNIDTAD